MNFLEKDWGRDYEVYSDDNVIVRRLEIKKGGKSTFGKYHRHRHKFNRFYLESGHLKLFLQKAEEVREITLEVSKIQHLRRFDIYPGVRHRFEALEDTICYEIYWSNCSIDDIVRDDE